MYSFRIEQAIKAATILHKDQVRKGEIPLPYVTHLISVAFLVADYTDNENALIAALLHDTIEDTDYRPEELEEDFGPEVHKIVLSVTEPKEEQNWIARKKVYEKQIQKGSETAKIVACADKIHNMRSATEEYYNDHVRFMHDFGHKLNERLAHYHMLSNIFNRDLNNDIVHEFNHVFTEYKNFIEHVKRTQEKSQL